MAMALTDAGVIKLNYAIAVGKTDPPYKGMHVVNGQAISVFEASGELVFNAFVMEQDLATGAITYKVLTNVVADYSWTDIYTPAVGKMGFVSLWVTNIGVTPGAYSFGIRGATVVTGETPPP